MQKVTHLNKHICESIKRRDIYTRKWLVVLIRNEEHAEKLMKYQKDWGFEYYIV